MTMVERMPSRLFVGVEPSQSAVAPRAVFPGSQEVLRALRTRWKLILAPPLLFLLAALGWLALMPPRYAAVTQILIDPHALQTGRGSLALPDPAGEASLLLVDNQIHILISDDVLARVVHRLDLDRDPDFTRPGSFPGSFIETLRGGLSALVGASAEAEHDPKLSALRTLRDRTDARRMERSFVVALSVSDQDRRKAVALSKAIAEAYLETVSDARSEVTRGAGDATTSRLGQAQEDLRRAEDRVQQFRAAHPLVGTSDQRVGEPSLTQLTQQLGTARARAAELRGRLDRIEAAILSRTDLNAVSDLVQSATLTQLRAQLARIEAARADTVADLGLRHPTLRMLELQIASLRGQIAAEIRRIAAAIRNDDRSTLAKADTLAATLEKRKQDALTADRNAARLRELERQAEASRQVQETLLGRARELEERQSRETSSARIISPASPSTERLGPSIPAVLVTALSAGLGTGLALALLSVAASGAIGSRRRLERITGLPVLATLPKKAMNPATTAALRIDSAYDVAVARLASRLQRAYGKTRPMLILVTSADDRRGALELARSLAVSTALDGRRVLLVDADPAGLLSGDLRLRAGRGGSEVMRTPSGLNATLMDGPAGVKILPFDDDAKGLGTSAHIDLILSTAAAFDTVFVDIGQIGTDIAAERLAQDERFSALLLTASATQSRVSHLRRALDAIGREPGLHLVLTDADAAI